MVFFLALDAQTIAVIVKMHGKYGPEFIQEGTPENMEMKTNVTTAVSHILSRDVLKSIVIKCKRANGIISIYLYQSQEILRGLF